MAIQSLQSIQAAALPITSPIAEIAATAMVVNINGYHFNIMSFMILSGIFALIYFFFKIQRSKRLDFADMLTKDGKAVSLTKVLQLVGGITATWVVIKMSSAGTLGLDIFAAYLAYVASIEGFSKFIAAKYNYIEGSVANSKQLKAADNARPSLLMQSEHTESQKERSPTRV